MMTHDTILDPVITSQLKTFTTFTCHSQQRWYTIKQIRYWQQQDCSALGSNTLKSFIFLAPAHTLPPHPAPPKAHTLLLLKPLTSSTSACPPMVVTGQIDRVSVTAAWVTSLLQTQPSAQ